MRNSHLLEFAEINPDKTVLLFLHYLCSAEKTLSYALWYRTRTRLLISLNLYILDCNQEESMYYISRN